MDIKIDPEFKSLIPPLDADELDRLHGSIIVNGCRDPLVVWEEEGILLDGHNRYEFCTRKGKPFKVVEKSFDSRDLARRFIIGNQLARRNLNTDQKAILAAKLSKPLQEEAMERKREGGARGGKSKGKDVANLPQASRVPPARDQAGAMVGVSGRKVADALAVQKADPALFQKVENGEVALGEAVRSVRSRKPSKPKKAKEEKSLRDKVLHELAKFLKKFDEKERYEVLRILKEENY